MQDAALPSRALSSTPLVMQPVPPLAWLETAAQVWFTLSSRMIQTKQRDSSAILYLTPHFLSQSLQFLHNFTASSITSLQRRQGDHTRISEPHFPPNKQDIKHLHI